MTQPVLSILLLERRHNTKRVPRLSIDHKAKNRTSLNLYQIIRSKTKYNVKNGSTENDDPY